MKRVAGLPHRPPGLERFHAAPSVQKTWDSFGDFENGSAKRELTHMLAEQQHGLCAYCEIDLKDFDRRVEHIVPRSDPIHGGALACDHFNLLAVCNGGSRPDIFGPKGPSADSSRHLPPTKANLSCDASKGSRPASAFLDPRAVPALPPLVSVTLDGELRANSAACARHGIDPSIVENHILGLNLNCERLRNARATVREQLLRNGAHYAPANYPKWVSASLLPDVNGRLEPFFTTARSLFGSLAETILARQPHVWV